MAQQRRLTLADLIGGGLISPGALLHFAPGASRDGRAAHVVTVLEDGRLKSEDGRTFASPTDAATALGGSIRNGWECWRLGGTQGPKLKDLRHEFEHRDASDSG